MNEIFIYAAIKQVDDRQVLEVSNPSGYICSGCGLPAGYQSGWYVPLLSEVLPVNGISLC